MKPRIFLAAHYLELGGAEMSLLGLLEALDPNKVDVDLFVYSHQGPLMKYIPSWVNLLPEIPEYTQIEKPLRQVFKNGFLRLGLARLKAKFRYKKWAKKHKSPTHEAYYQYLDNAIVPVLPSLKFLGKYNLAINFIALQGVISRHVSADKKIAWIHTDLSAVGVNVNIEFPSWNSFDYIASISPDVTKAFLSRFPTLKDKIIEIENILPKKYINSKSLRSNENFNSDNIHSHVLLSVGRLTFAKNYDNVPEIASHIVDMGVSNIKWYIIGFGGYEELIRRKIVEFGMENHVFLLGGKENPYPYILACDIYIQPSRYEGKSITVREAQMLGKPVVVTDYPTATSQIRNGEDGLIVPMDNKGCAKGIVDLINNPTLMKQLSENCLITDFSNISEVHKIYSII